MLAPNSTLDIGPHSETEDTDGASALADDAERNETDLVMDAEGTAALTFRPGASAGFPATLPPRGSVTIGLKITAPPEAKPGDVIEVDLVQRNTKGQVVGGITVRANIVKKK